MPLISEDDPLDIVWVILGVAIVLVAVLLLYCMHIMPPA